MKPVIGITASSEEDSLRIRLDYISAIANSGAVPLILPVSQRAAEFAELIDGLLLTGGGDIPPDYYDVNIPGHAQGFRPEKRERIDFELGLLAETIERRKPLLAICYGMQLLNVYHGGSLMRDISSAGAQYHDHGSGMHGITVSGVPFNCADGAYTVNSTHHQAVDRTGAGLSVFAVSDDGIIEGIFKSDYTFCVGVQWHPERIFTDSLSECILKSLAGKADEARRLR